MFTSKLSNGLRKAIIKLAGEKTAVEVMQDAQTFGIKNVDILDDKGCYIRSGLLDRVLIDLKRRPNKKHLDCAIVVDKSIKSDTLRLVVATHVVPPTEDMFVNMIIKHTLMHEELLIAYFNKQIIFVNPTNFKSDLMNAISELTPSQLAILKSSILNGISHMDIAYILTQVGFIITRIDEATLSQIFDEDVSDKLKLKYHTDILTGLTYDGEYTWSSEMCKFLEGLARIFEENDLSWDAHNIYKQIDEINHLVDHLVDDEDDLVDEDSSIVDDEDDDLLLKWDGPADEVETDPIFGNAPVAEEGVDDDSEDMESLVEELKASATPWDDGLGPVMNEDESVDMSEGFDNPDEPMEYTGHDLTASPKADDSNKDAE